ncbi:GNAT family N-acetyltransferase [Prochlorococcus marinus]|uniref:N-acetyltransferase domain-containing protein n=1 Tax=Prochlorococcus marinus (strain MIT 9211) TaxID=93059 RepID=A9BA68_PROM4|nr:GNAT family N-acetyltransferase [Prochlorococcus marinus]ABX08730.1 Hypothetical protein P9211_07991 [Prochlorococcus marinus str. MIT 9211]
MAKKISLKSSKLAIRRIVQQDHDALKNVYVESIEFQGSGLYSTQQIQAWSSKALLPNAFKNIFDEGSGWLSLEDQDIASFAFRYPNNRLALLYTLNKYSRRGHATKLLRQIELDAFNDGQECLVTEASLLSQPLLLKLGWQTVSSEKIMIAGIYFQRFRMRKLIIPLKPRS